MNDIKLKACPFCAGEATTEEITFMGAVLKSIGCHTEGCHGYQSTQTYPTYRQAAEAWNLRAGDREQEAAQSEAAVADSLQRVVSCCYSDDNGKCNKPATVEAYGTWTKQWYALCETHKINVVAPLRQISQPVAAANDPSSATRPTGRNDCNRDAHAGFAAAHG